MSLNKAHHTKGANMERPFLPRILVISISVYTIIPSSTYMLISTNNYINIYIYSYIIRRIRKRLFAIVRHETTDITQQPWQESQQNWKLHHMENSQLRQQNTNHKRNDHATHLFFHLMLICRSLQVRPKTYGDYTNSCQRESTRSKFHLQRPHRPKHNNGHPDQSKYNGQEPRQ